MHISVVQAQLKRGLHIVSHAVAAKAPLPVLSHVLLAAEGSRLRLEGSDLQTSIACLLEATVTEAGATTLPAKLLSDFVGTLPNDAVTLTLDGATQTTQLACANARANIKGLAAEEFPSPTVVETEATATIAGQELRVAVEQVAVMAAEDTTRPVLAGVLLKLAGTAITFAALDGFRLAVKTLTLPEPVATSQQVIVPAAALLALARVVADEDAVELAVTPGGGAVRFRTAAIEVTTRQLDGPFPAYERVIPQTYATRAIFERAALRQAVRQAALFVPERRQAAALHLAASVTDESGLATLVAADGELGDNKTELPAQIAGEGGVIKFNIALLKRAIEVIDTPQVAFEMQTPLMPGVLRPVGDDRLLLVVMPMA